jgi:(p)ppGpp synthase/HD superfamily hydrolase
MGAFESSASSLVREALTFAARAHDGRLRKYVGRPYVSHPIAVARLVTRFEHDDSMIAAALLHDVVEDCGVPAAEIGLRFGADVGALVSDLTDVSRPEDGNRARRKAIDRAHTAAASPRAKTIKALDLVHNSYSIVRFDPQFARVYLDEKAQILEVLADASAPAAVELARRVLRRGMATLAGQGRHERHFRRSSEQPHG